MSPHSVNAMRLVILLAPLLVALPAPGAGQSASAPLRAMPPHRFELHSHTDAAARSPALAPWSATAAATAGARRRRAVLPLAGAVVGGIAGVFWGNHELDGVELIGPPPHVITIPVGAALGALAGIIGNALFPPGRS